MADLSKVMDIFSNILSKKEITLRGRAAYKEQQARGEKALYRRQGLNARTWRPSSRMNPAAGGVHGRAPEVKRGFSVRGYDRPSDAAPTTHTSPKPSTPQEKLAAKRKWDAQVEYGKSPEGQAELKRQRQREDLDVQGINYDLDAKGNPVRPPEQLRLPGLMEKSRFEQQPNKGNFIPRPDPKKNTTPGNKEDDFNTSVILAKESPRPVPGTFTSREKKSVGRGKKARGDFEADASTADDATYVIGMKKAVYEYLHKVSSSTPDDERPGYLEGWVDRKRAERIQRADLDPRGHSTGGDATEKEKQVNRYHMWRGLANEKGELKGDPYPEALQDPDPPSVTNMKKAKDNIYAIATAAAKGDEDKKEEIVRALKRGKMILKAFGVMKARSAANRAAVVDRRLDRQEEKSRRQDRGLDTRLENVGMPVTYERARHDDPEPAVDIGENPKLIPTDEQRDIQVDAATESGKRTGPYMDRKTGEVVSPKPRPPRKKYGALRSPDQRYMDDASKSGKRKLAPLAEGRKTAQEQKVQRGKRVDRMLDRKIGRES